MTHFEDAAEWVSWLAEHHEAEGGTWLKIAKRSDRSAAFRELRTGQPPASKS